jgi:hypothetical protein
LCTFSEFWVKAMSDLRSNIGPSSTRRRVATAIAVIGVILVGSQLARAWPRDVQISYTVDPTVTAVDVDYLQEGEAVASARFRPPTTGPMAVQHTVRLRPGEYRARITVYGSDNGGVEHTRLLVVPTQGITHFDLKEAANPPE